MASRGRVDTLVRVRVHASKAHDHCTEHEDRTRSQCNRRVSFYFRTCRPSITRHFCPFLSAKNSTSKDTHGKIYYEAVRRRLKVSVGPSDVLCRVYCHICVYCRNARKIVRIYYGILYEFRWFVHISLIARAEGSAIRRYYTAIKIIRGE